MQHVSPRILWETALGQLELQVTRPNFDTWLRNTTGLRIDGDTLVVGVPSDFALEWLRTRLTAPIGHTLVRLLGRPLSITFEVLGIRADSCDADGSQESLSASQSLQPNPHFSFDSFVVVESTRFAHRAARQFASGGGKTDVLVLCGAPGLGKTHLLHAIAHAALEAGRRVVLLTGEEFVNGYGASVREGRPHTFRDAYNDCHLLLLDDLGFLASRAASQEQFFHIFNTLSSAGHRIAITCTAPPDQVSGLSPHLLSRLQSGLLLELKPPTQNERHEIVIQKASALSAPLPTAITQFIAEQPYESIRQLEGALNRIAAFAELQSEPLTLESARAALLPFRSPAQRPSIEAILAVVSAHFHIDRSQLAGPSRARDITYARHIAMYLLREEAQRPLAEIGTLLGNRDHSTVLNGCRRIARELASVRQTKDDLHHLQSLLNERSSA